MLLLSQNLLALLFLLYQSINSKVLNLDELFYEYDRMLFLIKFDKGMILSLEAIKVLHMHPCISLNRNQHIQILNTIFDFNILLIKA